MRLKEKEIQIYGERATERKKVERAREMEREEDIEREREKKGERWREVYR